MSNVTQNISEIFLKSLQSNRDICNTCEILEMYRFILFLRMIFTYKTLKQYQEKTL